MRTYKDLALILEKYNDEHAVRKTWNHFVTHGQFGKPVRDALAQGDKGAALSHMKAQLARAKKDPNHPLSFEKAKRGFPKSGKKDDHRASYEKEMSDALSGVFALATQRKFRSAVSGRQPARVTGGSDPNAKLSRSWKSGGGTNRTPKGDLEIYNPKNKKERRGVSMKKGGGSQLASAEPGEMRATYAVAARNVTKPNYSRPRKQSGESAADYQKRLTQMKLDARKSAQSKQQNIERESGKAAKLLTRMKTGSSSGNELRKRAAQRRMDALHKNNPGLTRQVSQVSASGAQKFAGKNAPGTAGTILTGVNKGKPATAKPIEQQPSANPRLAKPKGSNRPGNLKIDNR